LKPERVRIVGGRWRSRRLTVAGVEGLRPTPDRVRETLFNWLGQELGGLACLDLYAGSGALGFEAASRGAARVLMIERDRAALRMLERNRAALDAAQIEIVRADALAWLRSAGERFDVVFVDPPYAQRALRRVLAALPPRLAPGALVYAESDAWPDLDDDWRVARRGRAGRVDYRLLARADGAPT
jgi:16S rRNA (guanine966-N2)-methyltransferase